jgi:hypothetical protein
VWSWKSTQVLRESHPLGWPLSIYYGAEGEVVLWKFVSRVHRRNGKRRNNAISIDREKMFLIV